MYIYGINAHWRFTLTARWTVQQIFDIVFIIRDALGVVLYPSHFSIFLCLFVCYIRSGTFNMCIYIIAHCSLYIIISHSYAQSSAYILWMKGRGGDLLAQYTAEEKKKYYKRKPISILFAGRFSPIARFSTDNPFSTLRFSGIYLWRQLGEVRLGFRVREQYRSIV